MPNLFVHPSPFLSRLFGGTHSYMETYTNDAFLSRLFGGTLLVLAASHFDFFLSRLFGGTRAR